MSILKPAFLFPVSGRGGNAYPEKNSGFHAMGCKNGTTLSLLRELNADAGGAETRYIRSICYHQY